MKIKEKEKKTIVIACRGADVAPLSELFEFQGDLKKLSKENEKKLRKGIEELGFSDPFNIWIDFNDGNKKKILNGHQRKIVLTNMEKDGWIIPPLPINIIDAKDEKEAKMKLLALTSQFGEITDEGLKQFMKDSLVTIDEVISNFHFPEIDLDEFKVDLEKENEQEGNGDPDDVPEPPKEPKTKRGDLYLFDPYYSCSDCGKKYTYEEGSKMKECPCS